MRNQIAIFQIFVYTTCMPYYDEIFKHVTREYPRSLAALALKTPEVEVGEPLNTEHITVRMHHSDMTFHVHLPDEAAILHIEAQTDDSTYQPMPLRMLAYSSVLSLEHQKNVYSTVLYFRPPAGRRDPGFYRYGNAQRGGGWFQYNVIRVYELAGEAFLDPEAIGLLPFTALMTPPADMTPRAWVEKCIETTQSAAVDRETRATLLFGLSLFGSLVHPSELFQDSTLEAIMQESPFYEHVIERGKEQGIEQGIAQGREQGIEQGIAQGREQGAKATTIENIVLLLNTRFEVNTAAAVKPALAAIDDLPRLKQLLQVAIQTQSLEAFMTALKTNGAAIS